MNDPYRLKSLHGHASNLLMNDINIRKILSWEYLTKFGFKRSQLLQVSGRVQFKGVLNAVEKKKIF